MASEPFERRLAAIVAADVVGYSRLMGADEAGTLSRLTALRQELVEPKIADYHGRIVKLMGDGLLVEFASVVDALAAAVEVQRAIAARNEHIPEDQQILIRMGINLGDILIQDNDIFGDGVNIAARLEPLAEPGGICISQMARDGVGNKLPLKYEDMGEQQVKNIAEPVRVYRVQIPSGAVMPIAGSAPNKPATSSILKHRRIGSALAAMAVVAIVATFFLLYQPKPVPQTAVAVEANMAYPLPDKPSIVVLPFNNLSNDKEQEFFVDGITDSIITNVAKISNLFVIDRNSTFAYKGKPVTVKQAAEELGVRYVLEGSIQKSGNRVRINAQLVDALTGKHLWVEDYDREMQDVFALQDDITWNIATALEIKLFDGESAGDWRSETNSPEAYFAFRQSTELIRDGKNPLLARQLLEKAVSLDPEFASAWAMMGFAYRTEARSSAKNRDAILEQAIEVGQKALDIDENNATAYSMLGGVYMDQGKHDEAIAAAEKSVTLSPNGAGYIAMLGIRLTNAGRAKEGVALIKKSMRLNPYYQSWMLWVLGQAYWQLKEYEQAIAAYEDFFEHFDNDSPKAYTELIAIYVAAGRLSDARATMAKLLEQKPAFTLKDVDPRYIKDPVERKEFLDALIQAGLPE